MKLKTFFEKFDQLADAPNAVEKMRELVTELAVRGKLVPQAPNDEPANFSVDTHSDAPFELPETWGWTHLGHLQPEFQNGVSSRGDKDGMPVVVIRLADVERKRISLDDPRTIAISKDQIAKYKLQIGDTLITRVNGSADIVGTFIPILESLDAIYCDHFIRMRIDPEQILPAFAALVGDSQHVREQIRSLFITTAGQKTVNQGHIRSLSIPLPPLAEQNRIVAKVDELMALCDRLEALQHERDNQATKLARASLARFADAHTPANLNLLFHSSFSIPPSDLRKSILNLAVQGKLVPQDPNDEPAERLFSKIQTRLVELQSAYRVPKPQSQFSQHGGFEETLPKSWKQVRIGDLCLSIVPQRDKPLSFTGNIPWVTLPLFKENSVSLALGPDCEGLSLEEVEKYRLRIVPAGSVLMSCVGRFGLVAILDRDVVPNQQIHGFRFPPELLDGHFLCYSIMAQKSFLEAQSTTTTIAYLNKTKCESLPVALPPLPEQRRIVAKVEQLMALVDALEQQLAASLATAEKLLTALVAELTNGKEADATVKI